MIIANAQLRNCDHSKSLYKESTDVGCLYNCLTNDEERMPTPRAKPRIVVVQTGGSFATSIKNTNMSQRETLEAIILNLAEALGIGEVLKVTSARRAEFYRPSLGSMSFQSATNTIYELSRMVRDK